MARSICLISCSASKLDRAAPSGEIYTGQLFRASRSWADRNGLEFAILSAKHGLLMPFEVIEPYDFRMPNNKQAKKKWAYTVLSQIQIKFPFPDTNKTELIFLAGNDYREHLAMMCSENGYKVIELLAGMGIGKQLKSLKL